MPIKHFSDILDLMERAQQHGIRLSHNDSELTVEFRKGETINPALLKELSNNKYDIIGYLKQAGIQPVDYAAMPGFTCDEACYYDISPTQLYWVNDQKDKAYKEQEEVHGVIILSYKVSGQFMPALFSRAVTAVVNHHESLRATFHKIQGSYMMRVEPENSPAYEMDYQDLRTYTQNNIPIPENIIKISDRKLALDKGPLFLSRIIQTGDEEFIVTIKLHHVISDTWSNEILLRDLLLSYKNLHAGKPPLLPPLRLQFRDILSSFNTYRQQHLATQQFYWHNLYKQLPPTLIMPGAKLLDNQPLATRIRKRFPIEFPEACRRNLHLLSKTNNTTLFVILQATFKTFLYCKTGIPDLLIGTIVSGRDTPESYHQIGSYARTELIRTVFHKDTSFSEAIHCVKKANDELANFKAYTLTNAIESLMQNGQPFEDFWKINMLYSDTSIFHTTHGGYGQLMEGLDMHITPLMDPSNALMPLHMILDFFNMENKLILDVQYDSSLYNEDVIQNLFAEYLLHTNLIAENINAPLKICP